MRRFDLGMSVDYCSQWGTVEAVREFFQNCYDAEVVNPANKMFWDYDDKTMVLRVGNKDGHLLTKTLLLGMSSKRENNDTIGKHGEGYKVATVVLMRLGKTVTIYNRHDKEIWRSKIVKSRRYNANIVVFDIEKISFFKSVPDYDLIFEISGITPQEYADIVESNLHLQKLNAEDYRQADKSRVLLSDKHAGKLFVGGLFVCKSKVATYGYDFEPSLITLDRDRGIVDSLDLQFLCAKVLCKTGDMYLIEDAKDVWDGEYIRLYIKRYLPDAASELFDKECSKFYKQYGDDAIPVTDTDEFNRLKRNGFNAVMVKSSTSYYITNSSSYSGTERELEDLDSDEVMERLDAWFSKYIDEGTEAYEEGMNIIEDIRYLLS